MIRSRFIWLCFLPVILVLLIGMPVILNYPVNAYQSGYECPQTRLTPGGSGRVAQETANRVRDTAGKTGKVVGIIPSGGLVDVLEGPECTDGFLWWKINYDGLSGWTAEGSIIEYLLAPEANTATLTPTPTTTAGVFDVNTSPTPLPVRQSPRLSPGIPCTTSVAPQPRLYIGAMAQLVDNWHIRVRELPGLQGTELTRAQGHTVVQVLDGPECVDGYNWWQIHYNDLTGWAAEAVNGSYVFEVLSPTATTTPTFTPTVTFTATITQTPTTTLTPTVTWTPTITPTKTPVLLPAPNNVSWSADGQRLAVNTREGVYLYDAANFGGQPHLLTTDVIYSILFSPVDATALYCLDGEGIHLLDTDQNRIIASYELNRASYGLMHFTGISSDANIISFDRGYWFDLVDASMHFAAQNHQVDASVVNHTGELTAQIALDSTGSKPRIILDDSQKSTIFDFYRGYSNQYYPVIDIAFSPDDSAVATLDEQGSIRLWSLASDKWIVFIRTQADIRSTTGSAIAYHPDGKTLATGESYPQGIVRIFETTDLKPLAIFGLPEDTRIRDLAYNPDGSMLAVAVDDTVRILNTTDYTEITSLVIKH